MNVYRNPLKRAALGATAVAMTGIVIVLSVIAPASVQSHQLNTGARSVARMPATIEADIVPNRIEVVGVRKSPTASMQPAKPHQG